MGSGTAGGGYRDRSMEAYRERRERGEQRAEGGEGDDQWVAEEGVAPVIGPSVERPHDPGPGVIGIDR